MEYVTKGYKPQRALEIFEELSAIPHGSGNESGIAEYIIKFAERLGYPATLDKTGNVFVCRPACAGYENREPILLQGHMDMVCEKNSDCPHDFEHEGLDLFVDEGWLGAHGTTLGGDDGIAVAMMLAMLEEENMPMLELLFTVEEETGLAGAKGFDASRIKSRIMINLDSEDEFAVTAGCAGGVRSETEFSFSDKDFSHKSCVAVITISGLFGGHSGVEINRGRANAIVTLSRILSVLSENVPISLVSINGGGKDNAIAREASATVAFDNVADKDKIESVVLASFAEIKKELSAEDASVCIKIETADGDFNAINREKTLMILDFLACSKTGVLKMSNDIDGLVEFSRNLGVAKTEKSKIRFVFSSRSSLEFQIDTACREADTLARLCGAENHNYARYPGWEYAPNSPLRERYLDAYEGLYGVRPTVVVIHAGLECGILSSKLEGMDIISIGPNMRDIHSPDERLELASCERLWKTLLVVIKQQN